MHSSNSFLNLFQRQCVCVRTVTVDMVLGCEVLDTHLLNKYAFCMWQSVIMTADQIGLRFFELWKPVLCFLKCDFGCRLSQAFFCTWSVRHRENSVDVTSSKFVRNGAKSLYAKLSGLFFFLAQRSSVVPLSAVQISTAYLTTDVNGSSGGEMRTACGMGSRGMVDK